jgi:hypothetical protein
MDTSRFSIVRRGARTRAQGRFAGRQDGRSESRSESRSEGRSEGRAEDSAEDSAGWRGSLLATVLVVLAFMGALVYVVAVDERGAPPVPAANPPVQARP